MVRIAFIPNFYNLFNRIWCLGTHGANFKDKEQAGEEYPSDWDEESSHGGGGGGR